MRGDVGVRRVVGDLVVDVDLVDDRRRERRSAPRARAGRPAGRRPRPSTRSSRARRRSRAGGAGPGPGAWATRRARRVAVAASSSTSSSGRRDASGRSATSATRQSAQRVDPTRYSAPHDGHHSVGSSTGGECTGAHRYDVGMSADAATLPRRDARLPEERRRLRQGRRLAAGRRPRCPRDRPTTPTSSSSTRARSSRRRARSRSTSRSRSPTTRKPGARARRDRLHGRALRRRARAPRCPRPTRSSGSRARARSSSVVLRGRKPAGVRDLLELPRPAPSAPWAYVKVAEGCDRACAFCAIPSFRGKQRSRTPEAIEAEARALVEQGVAEIVLVAQDLAWYGRDAGEPGSLAPLLRRLDALRAARPRARAAALPLSVRGEGPARRDDARAAERRAVLRPLAAARGAGPVARA